MQNASLQCKQMIKTVVLSEKLRILKFRSMSRETRKPAKFNLYLWQAVMTIFFHFTTLFQLFQLFIAIRLVTL